MDIDGDESLFGEVDLSSAQKRVMLVKIPNFLAQAWMELPSNTELGTVKIKEEKDSGKLAEMKLILKGDYANEFPKEYNIDYTQSKIPMQIFSELKQGQVSIEGSVEYQCDVKPLDSQVYRHLVRERVEKTKMRERALIPIEENQVGSFKIDKQRLHDPKKRRMEDRRERMGKEELMDVLFTIFEEKTHFDLRTLVERTDQPMQYLKDILSEICVYNKRGKNKSLYELKPQYKKKISEQDGKEESS